MSEIFIKFKQDGFWMSKQSSFKTTIEHCKYYFISCLNQFQRNSLYFKYQATGFCLIFTDEQALDGKQTFKHLMLLKNADQVDKPSFEMGRVLLFFLVIWRFD